MNYNIFYHSSQSLFLKLKLKQSKFHFENRDKVFLYLLDIYGKHYNVTLLFGSCRLYLLSLSGRPRKWGL